MKYAIYPKPVLGPCACQDCGEPLYWARRNTTVLHVVVGSLRWRDWNGRIHQCSATVRQRRYNGRLKEGRYPQLSLARARAKGYNKSAGTSSIQIDFRIDAVPLLVPGGAASMRVEGRD